MAYLKRSQAQPSQVEPSLAKPSYMPNRPKKTSGAEKYRAEKKI
jgi:hypothetical protein